MFANSRIAKLNNLAMYEISSIIINSIFSAVGVPDGIKDPKNFTLWPLSVINMLLKNEIELKKKVINRKLVNVNPNGTSPKKLLESINKNSDESPQKYIFFFNAMFSKSICSRNLNMFMVAKVGAFSRFTFNPRFTIKAVIRSVIKNSHMLLNFPSPGIFKSEITSNCSNALLYTIVLFASKFI